MTQAAKVIQSIKSKKAIVGVVGIGYVGQAVANAAVRAGFTTIGFDIDAHKVDHINKQGKFKATCDMRRLAQCRIITICVPTPLTRSHKPELMYIKKATQTVACQLTPPVLITIESSLAPGMTREEILPILTQAELSPDRDFWLSHSPERIDPGNQKFQIHDIPKIVSGMSAQSLKVAISYYRQLVNKVIPVSSLETAELAKVLENTFRFVNISLINEIAACARPAGINICEVIDAAATKPFGFLPHYPGPGIGGECIPVLPRYLIASSSKHHIEQTIVNAAINVDKLQTQRVVTRSRQILEKHHAHEPKRAQVLLIGLTYKRNVADLRQSPALKIWQLLKRKDYKLAYHDPYTKEWDKQKSVTLTAKDLKKLNLIIITTPHSKIDYKALVNSKVPILDTHNALKSFQGSHIYRL